MEKTGVKPQLACYPNGEVVEEDCKGWGERRGVRTGKKKDAPFLLPVPWRRRVKQELTIPRQGEKGFGIKREGGKGRVAPILAF